MHPNQPNMLQKPPPCTGERAVKHTVRRLFVVLTENPLLISTARVPLMLTFWLNSTVTTASASNGEGSQLKFSEGLGDRTTTLSLQTAPCDQVLVQWHAYGMHVYGQISN